MELQCGSVPKHCIVFPNCVVYQLQKSHGQYRGVHPVGVPGSRDLPLPEIAPLFIPGLSPANKASKRRPIEPSRYE